MKPYAIPERPLERFTEIYGEFNARRRWFQDPMVLRFAALTLVTTDAAPTRLADDLFELAKQLRERAGWFGPLNSPIRFLLASILMRNGDGAESFCREIERVQGLFRARDLRRGSIYEVMAILILRESDPDGVIDAAMVDRFKALYEMMKTYHWWLTGPDDYPACALLARRTEPPAEIGGRIEKFYEALVETGMSRGDPLQMVSHILYFNPREPAEVLNRFRALHDGFKRADISMWQTDYDELAILTFLDHRADEIVARVVRHRAHMAELSPKPDRVMTFSLACATAFLELVRLTDDLKLIQDARTLSQVQAVIAARQAACAAAASS
jgi:hypothetical protein